MSYFDRQLVSRVATEVLWRYWKLREMPVDPVRICNGMGIQLAGTNEPGVCAWYRAPALIEMATELPVNRLRQRYALAHALAFPSLGLGPQAGGATIADYTRDQADATKAAANQFALALLMPAEAVISAVDDRGMTRLEQLSEHFAVSEVAIQTRLKQLGLIS